MRVAENPMNVHNDLKNPNKLAFQSPQTYIQNHSSLFFKRLLFKQSLMPADSWYMQTCLLSYAYCGLCVD